MGMSGVFTLPPDLCFVSTLARGLWRRAGGDPLALSSCVVYLPTRRACRALRDAFLRVAEEKAVLLPRLRPLGDIDEAEMEMAGDEILDDLPPAIAPLRRQMLLTRLVMKKDGKLPIDQAALLAQALGALLDQAQTEGRDFADLRKIVPDDHAEHWQETLRFLEIVTDAWPKILAQEGCLDLAERRRRVLLAQARAWRENPPGHPVLAAGSTGSVPAAGALMATIAALPLGEVVLPGLDLEMTEEAWQEIDETHPQATMKHWLESSGVEREQVRVWEGFSSPRASRVKLLREALLPPKMTKSWRSLTTKDVPPEATAGLEKLELDHHREEAEIIALRLRAALEEEKKTAALVTPDRALAARVAAALGRWGIAANDSAGTPLSAWPVGSFLNDVLAAAAPDASPMAYLSLLKHPLATAGLSAEECRRLARAAEKEIWRGVRLSGGWSGAARAAEEKALSSFLRRLTDLFDPLVQNWGEEKPLADHLAAHIGLAEKLADPARLWRGEGGQEAAAWLDDLRAASADFPPLTGEAYAGLFGALIEGVIVRPAFGAHPRLNILGPLEARLLHHDLVILGGLNEGVWPPAPPVDPWLSRPMKRDFGLPSPERRVGLSAHDFVQLACAERVLFTRAKRIGGSPSVPSRFLLQVETVLRGVGEEDPLRPQEPWRAWARALYEPEVFAPVEPPEPCPPPEARPTQFSVTEIGTWLRNPYAIYARRILNLKKLDDIDADAGAAEQGDAVHKALEKFTKKTKAAWPDNPLALLLQEGRKAFEAYEDRPQVKAFWWPRFERIAAWFVEEEEKRRSQGIHPLDAEAEGKVTIGTFCLTGRADRIDLLKDGSVEIIDYKTGRVPKPKFVKEGIEPQLPLLGLIAAEGGFKNLEKRETSKLSYWALGGAREVAQKTSFTEDVAVQIEKAREGLESLIRTYGDPKTPYRAVPRPALAPDYDDYEHLSRLKEWSRGRGGKK